MNQRVFIRRTRTPNKPPNGLAPGELFVEMSDPLRLWTGVPPSIDPTQRRLLVDRSEVIPPPGPGGGASVHIAEVPPADVNPGDLWFESDTGQLYVYYEDATSSQWVGVAVQGPPGLNGAAGPTGSQGPQGPVGPQGSVGATGSAGPQGPAGVQGPKGDKGDTGNTGATGPQGPAGVTGALLTTEGKTTSAVLSVNTPAASTGARTEGVEIANQAITVKSATSRLIVRGGAIMFANTDMNGYLFLYTSLNTAYVGAGRGYLSASCKAQTIIGESAPFAHGQPAGTVITASSRGSRTTTADNITVNGSAPATPFSPPTMSWLSVEEVV